MTLVLIGVDDTDVVDSPGTGRLVRELAAELDGGPTASRGVTRHQLWKHPSIPYTSQNSANCLGLETTLAPAALADRVATFLRQRYVAGADPAFAVAEPGWVNPALAELARRAQREKLTVAAVMHAAQASGLIAQTVAGEPVGLVGAIAAVALRAGGDDGRFIDLPGIRHAWDEPTVGELLAETAIAAVVDEQGAPVAPDARVAVHGWLRPSLRNGRAALVVAHDGASGRWVNVENRHRAGPHHRDA